jgi:hypothetical protein
VCGMPTSHSSSTGAAQRRDAGLLGAWPPLHWWPVSADWQCNNEAWQQMHQGACAGTGGVCLLPACCTQVGRVLHVGTFRGVVAPKWCG